MKTSTAKRKKLTLALSVMALAAMFALAGCSASNDEVMQKLDSLETQVDELQAQGEEMAANADSATTQDSGSAPATVADFESELASLEQSVTKALTAVENVVVSGDADARAAAYREAMAPLEALDGKLDLLDDSLEAAYANGSLNQVEYQALETALEVLENQLDQAEDALEIRLGIND